ncbi:MAG: hypothetical protein CMO81_04055 [Waddliaceae bacterium]|nr:hypothetical protein [Waddliaceae bacterium]
MLQRIHQRIFQIGFVFMLSGFIGFMIFVLCFAQSRKSGSTGIDASKLSEIRHPKITELSEK